MAEIGMVRYPSIMWRRLSAKVEEAIRDCGGGYMLMWRRLSAQHEYSSSLGPS